MAMSPDVEARQTVSGLQKKLFRLNNGLRDALDSEDDLRQIFQDIERLRDVAHENAPVQELLRQKLAVDSVIANFKEAKQKYSQARKFLEKYDDFFSSSDSILERFRTYRYYEFKNEEGVGKFLKSACKNYQISELWAKPELLGSVNLQKIAEEFHLPQQGKLYCGVPVDHFSKFLEKVVGQKPTAGVYFESFPMAFLWRPGNVLKVDASTDNIRELDEIARSQGVSIIDK